MNKGDRYNDGEYLITYRDRWKQEKTKKFKGSEHQLNNEIYKLEHIYHNTIVEIEVINNIKQGELFQ